MQRSSQWPPSTSRMPCPASLMAGFVWTSWGLAMRCCRRTMAATLALREYSCVCSALALPLNFALVLPLALALPCSCLRVHILCEQQNRCQGDQLTIVPLIQKRRSHNAKHLYKVLCTQCKKAMPGRLTQSRQFIHSFTLWF